MASNSTLSRRLNAMADGRVDALRRQARQGIALEELERNGEVTSATVEARLADEWSPPTDAALANLMAQKAASGVDVTSADVEAYREIETACRDRVARLEARLAEAREAVTVAERQTADAEKRHTDAVELHEFAAARGDAAAAPAGEPVEVRPAAAEASADAQDGGR